METEESAPKLSLGIDLGTTSVKVCLVDLKARKTLAESSKPHHAGIQGLPSGHDEQSPSKIFEALEVCMKNLEETFENLQLVEKIGVSGQMHGCVLWKTPVPEFGEGGHFMESNSSHLITWQDKRTDEDFLKSLPEPISHERLCSGYGWPTLIWLKQNIPSTMTEYQATGTIMDYLVSLLTGTVQPKMTAQNANSWGFFDSVDAEWNPVLTELVPPELIPDVVQPGEIAGKTRRVWHKIRAGTPVLAGLGDFQATVAGIFTDCKSAILNIGTSAQLSYLLPPTFQIPRKPDPKRKVQYFPYFGGTHLTVAASLNGGNALATFVEAISSWTSTLNPDAALSKEDMWIRVKALLSSSQEATDNQAVSFQPKFLGERHSPSDTGSIMNVNGQNLGSLRQILHSLIDGLVLNLNSMLQVETLVENGIQTVLLIGQATEPYFVKAASKLYESAGLKIQISDQTNSAAFGAALC